MAIRTTFITGFPGETEGDHQELLEFIEEIGFDMLGVFRYSPEPGTPAGRMDQDPALRVDDETKLRREREIMMLQQQIAFEQAAYLAEQFDPADPENTGVVFDVLIDESFTEPSDDGLYEATGRAYFQAPGIDSVTAVRSRKPLSPGELVRCTVTSSDGYDLIASPREDLRRAVSLPVIG
jgi:ribosomal protein S12 methylthiotransferase